MKHINVDKDGIVWTWKLLQSSRQKLLSEPRLATSQSYVFSLFLLALMDSSLEIKLLLEIRKRVQQGQS
jgi:hypothetical protein